jgi:hypothetical protein
MAVDNQVSAGLAGNAAQRAGHIVRPATSLEIVSCEASSVHRQPHEKFAFHGCLGLPNRLGTCKLGVGQEKHIVCRLDCEDTVRSATPDCLVHFPLRQISAFHNVPKVQILGYSLC